MLNKTALLCLCYMASAGAHDFWIQPRQYWLQSTGTTSLTLEVGHGPYRQRSPLAPSRIKRFEALTPSGARHELRGSPPEIDFEEPGTYVLVLETDNRAQSHLPAIRFNDYLQSEGLTPALEERKRTRRMDAEGSESYSRRAKALVHVGQADAAATRQVIQPLGLALEIVPEVNPYIEPRPAALPVKVLFEGRPLPGATIKLTQLEHDEAPFETHLTDAAGRAVFSMPMHGSWLLNVVWTQVLPKSSATDFDTVFSSLSFGFSAAGPGAGTP
jgi:uncharacterized GH25 family protein